jgi:hypothetical protein
MICFITKESWNISYNFVYTLNLSWFYIYATNYKANDHFA